MGLKLSNIISSGAVFQRNQPIFVFGEGDGNITVEFSGETKEVTAHGKFVAELPPKEAGGPYEMKISDGVEEIRISDLYVGEVILISGQSNAALQIKDSYDRDTVFQKNPLIRCFEVAQPKVDKALRTYDYDGILCEKWSSLSPENAGEWSAIGLNCALNEYRKLQIPVGIVECFKGASVIESFLSEAANRKFCIDQSKLMSDHRDPTYGQWNKPSYLFHKMLEKIIPYGIGSVVWYQGESNRTVYEGSFYDRMLFELVSEWRVFFKNPTLPFAVVQINLFPAKTPEDGVAAIRAAQERAVRDMENAFLIKIDDFGEYEKIHPENKKAVADRICEKLFEKKGAE